MYKYNERGINMQSSGYYRFYSHSKILSGKKAMEHIPFELESLNSRKPLVITSRAVTDRGLTKKFIKAMKASGMVIGALYDDAPSYSGSTIINELAKLHRHRGCDSVIAMGAGPVADIAKGVNLLATFKEENILIFRDRTISQHLNPLVMIPAGGQLGGEMSSMAHIESFVLPSDHLFPDVVVLDDRMTRPGSSEAAVNSAMASLTHAIEASAFPHNDPINDAYAHATIQFVYENLLKSAKRPNNRAAGLALANASASGDVCLSNSPAGLVKLLANAIYEETGIPHGISMGIILPYHLQLKLDSRKKVREELLMAMTGIDEYAQTPAKERSSRAVQLLWKLQDDLSRILPRSFKELNVPGYKLKSIAERAALLSEKRYKPTEALKLLTQAWEGRA